MLAGDVACIACAMVVVVVVVVLLTTFVPPVMSTDDVACCNNDEFTGRRGPRFMFVGLARNCRNSMLQWCRWVMNTVAPHIRERWPGALVGIVVFENGSTDGTDTALDELCARCPDSVERVPVSVLPDRDLHTAAPSTKHYRTQKFALLRNRLLDFLRQSPYESDIVQVIPCDLDLDFSQVDPQSVVRAMEAVREGEYPWVAGASAWPNRNPLRWITGDADWKYYDTFAVRDAYCTQDLSDQDLLNGQCQPYMTERARPGTETWFPVDAAFGGISVYAWDRYKRQVYSAPYAQVCEHISVCRGMGTPGVIYAKLSPKCR